MWRSGPSSQPFPFTTACSSTVRVTDANGCTSLDSAAVVVSVNALPVATISPSTQQAICAGTSVSLTASASVSCLWSNGAITQTISVNNAGSYTVRVTDANGCTSPDSAAVDVTVNALPVATINPTGPQAICAGSSVSLTASAGVSWLWSNGAITQTIIVNKAGS